MSKEYLIQVVEDNLVAAAGNVPEHYEEQIVATIGSNTLDYGGKAQDPKLTLKSNGEVTFSFSLYTSFYGLHGKEDNPYLNLLYDERKLKVKWQDNWYDFVITNHTQDTKNHTMTFSCVDSNTRELGKQGNGIVLDGDLNNNSGTVTELATLVAENSEWKVVSANGKIMTIDADTGLPVESDEDAPDSIKSDVVRQYLEEPVYVVAANNLKAKNSLTGIEEIITGSIYVYRSPLISLITNKVITDAPFLFQFSYCETPICDGNSMLITNDNKYEIDTTAYSSGSVVFVAGLTIDTSLSVSSAYRAKRLVRSQKTDFDTNLGRYVTEYKSTLSGQPLYGYTDTEFTDTEVITNLVTNGTQMYNLSGWIIPDTELETTTAKLKNYPVITSSTVMSTYNGHMYFHFSSKNSSFTLENSGFNDNLSFISDGIQVGEVLSLRYKAYDSEPTEFDEEGNPTYPGLSTKLTLAMGDYFSSSGIQITDDYTICDYTCIKSITKEELKTLPITFNIGSNLIIIGECWLFKRVENEDGVVILPATMDSTSTGAILSTSKVRYNYYDSLPIAANEDERVYHVREYVPFNKSTLADIYEPVYVDDYQKILSVDAQNSNRFNILQDIIEKFECWIHFYVQRDSATGKPIYDENGRAKKYIYFTASQGEDNGLTFIYGLDLQSISRTDKSDEITTKTIVKINTNEYAPNGYCAIGNAPENPSGENFIYNFDYYVNKGLLGTNIYTDLNKLYYGDSTTKGLSTLNEEMAAASASNTSYSSELIDINAALTTDSSLLTSYQEQLTDTGNDICSLAGQPDIDSLSDYIKKYYDQAGTATNSKLDAAVRSYINLQTQISLYTAYVSSLTNRKADIEKIITANNEIITTDTTAKETLINVFETKYHSFINEGTWNDDSYTDDTNYYLDAMSVAYTSSRPKVSYNISVLSLSCLDQFKNKIFHVGDVAGLEDTEYFGYLSDGITPYKEKVLISEITYNFEKPSSDSITVKNYATEFDDLFQRLTAASQQLQYSSGDYNRAAATIDNTGTVASDKLQQSLDNSRNLQISGGNGNVTFDGTGITVYDNANKAYRVKMTSKGIQSTEDGGENWTTLISRDGISTHNLSNGVIDLSRLNINANDAPYFKLDEHGLHAYSYAVDTSITPSKIVTNKNRFVRFDQYGIYGVNKGSGVSLDEWTPSSMDEIDGGDGTTSTVVPQFGLTWRKFFLKSATSGERLELTSDEGLKLYSENSRLAVHLGKIDDPSGEITDSYYGIKILDNDENDWMMYTTPNSLYIKGSINATSGAIGGWNIGTDSLYTTRGSTIGFTGIGNLTTTTAAAIGAHNNLAMRIGSSSNATFGIGIDGKLYATGADISGKITASSGSIGDLSIDSQGLKYVNSSSETTFQLRNNEISVGLHDTGWIDLVFSSNSPKLQLTNQAGANVFYASGAGTNDAGYVALPFLSASCDNLTEPSMPTSIVNGLVLDSVHTYLSDNTDTPLVNRLSTKYKHTLVWHYSYSGQVQGVITCTVFNAIQNALTLGSLAGYLFTGVDQMVTATGYAVERDADETFEGFCYALKCWENPDKEAGYAIRPCIIDGTRPNESLEYDLDDVSILDNGWTFTDYVKQM